MSGIGMLDLLSLSPEEQAIIRCLIQQSPLSSHEIAERTSIDVERLEAVLLGMARRQQVQQHEQDGRSVFAVQLRRQTQRVRGRSLLDVSEEAV